jgi:ubiquinone biosynthesis protein UbiJ
MGVRRLLDMVRLGWWLWWRWGVEMVMSPVAQKIVEIAGALRDLAAIVSQQHERDRDAMTEATTGAAVAAGEDFAAIGHQVDALRAEVAELSARLRALEHHEREHSA